MDVNLDMNMGRKSAILFTEQGIGEFNNNSVNKKMDKRTEKDGHGEISVQRLRTAPVGGKRPSKSMQNFKLGFVKRNNYPKNAAIERLKEPKREFNPSHPYDHADYRGLILPDHKEALNNCYTYNVLINILFSSIM